MKVKVSVLVGVRDDHAGLLRTLESLRRQTFEGWECVVVDDGSVRAVGRETEAFSDPRIRVIRQKPAGLTAALRRGMSELRGELVARVDASDECEPERLELQCRFLDANPAVCAVGGAVTLVDARGRMLSLHRYPAEHADLRAELRDLVTPIPHSTLMMRRDAFDAAGGYRARFVKAQDYDLLLRLSEAGRLASLAEPLVKLQVRGDSMSFTAEGGRQFEYCVLGYACSVVRALGRADPLDGADVERFLEDFSRWFPTSRYPALYESRKARREARLAAAERKPVATATALARSLSADPGWPLRRWTDADVVSAEAEEWASSWVEGRR